VKGLWKFSQAKPGGALWKEIHKKKLHEKRKVITDLNQPSFGGISQRGRERCGK